MNTDPVIRRAKPGDAISIQRCVESAYRHYIDRIGKPPGPMLEDYDEVIRRHSVYVAEADDIVAVLVLIRSAQGMLLDNVAVHPRCQGRGLGKRLLQIAEHHAVAQGFEALDLYTHECMIENIEIYKSLGYRETRRKEEKGFRRVYMRKNLSG